jgi:dolichyl-phosphate-mannose--protein O-mannosyl transferase
MISGSRRSIRNWELLGLTVAALATHLWRIGQPNAVVFDELFSDTFAGHYLAGA